MKVCQLFLVLFILCLIPSIWTKQIVQEFDQIVNFLQTNTVTKANQSNDLFLNRVAKIRRKKEIIIKRIYEISPIFGEILALANVEKIDLIVNKFFILREMDLFKKHIIMWDADSNYLDHSSKVLLNILLCNNKFNRLRSILNLLMDGLCIGDDRSLRIFKEIIITVIIETLIKTKFNYFIDLKAKFNLIRIFNKPFHFKPIIKIKFIDQLKISDKLKELLTFTIMQLKTNEDIEVETEKNIHKIPSLLANNTNIFKFVPSTENLMGKLSPEEKQNTLQSELEKSIDDKLDVKVSADLVKLDTKQGHQTLSRKEANEILDNLSSYSSSTSMRFKEQILLENENNEKTFTYSELKMIDPAHLEIPQIKKMKLSEIKEELKNEYTDFLFNQTSASMPQLEEVEPNYQIGIKNRSIFTKYRKHIQNLIKLNVLLDEFPLNTIKGSIDVSTPVKTITHTKTTITKEVAPGFNVSMQFKEQEKGKFRFKSEIGNSINAKSSLSSSTTTTSSTTTIKALDFAEKSFQALTGINNFNKNDITNGTNNNYNSPDKNTNPDSHDAKKNYNDDNQIMQKIIDQNQNSKEIKDLMIDKNVKVLFPKEIQNEYKITKRGTRTIEINSNSKIII